MELFKRVHILLGFLLITLLQFTSTATAQDDDFFLTVEQMPELHGSIDSLSKEAGYTRDAYEAGVEGRVYVQFIVTKDGTVSDARVLRGLHKGLDKEALETIKQARFTPGRQRGQNVRVQMSLPITFKLSDVEMPEPPEESTKGDKGNVFMAVEEMPQLKGGLAQLQQKINYPDMAKKAGIEGRVVVKFIVEKDGSVSNAKVLRGIGGGCDEEALRIVKQAKFKPGRHGGKPVRVQYSLPIPFQLRD